KKSIHSKKLCHMNLEIEKRPYFIGSYDFSWESYVGPDFGRKAFLFPGQGAATPGMLQGEFRKNAEFKEVFAQVDQFAIAKGLSPASLYLLDHSKIPAEHLAAVRNLALF